MCCATTNVFESNDKKHLYLFIPSFFSPKFQLIFPSANFSLRKRTAKRNTHCHFSGGRGQVRVRRISFFYCTIHSGPIHTGCGTGHVYKLECFSFDVACVWCGHPHSHQQVPFAWVALRVASRVLCGLGLSIETFLRPVIRPTQNQQQCALAWKPLSPYFPVERNY